MTLSILICSLESRASMLKELCFELQKQITDYTVQDFENSQHIEVLTNIDNRQKSTGLKRQELLEQATGKYIIFIDDDDWPEPCYIAELMKACASDADCFAMNGYITTNGHYKIPWRLSRRYINETIHEGGQMIYLRTTNHITGVKRELALQAGFPDKSNAEDKWYSERVVMLCKSEYEITPPMYHYRFNNHKNDSYK